jgi:hypothetical protein
MSEIRFMGFRKHPLLKSTPYEYVYPAKDNGFACNVNLEEREFIFYPERFVCRQRLLGIEFVNPVFRVPAIMEKVDKHQCAIDFYGKITLSKGRGFNVPQDVEIEAGAVHYVKI